MSKEKTTWKSIGGNNEDRIGGNAHAYTYTDKEGKSETLLIDLGSMFSDKSKTGYDTFLPDAAKYIPKDGKPAEEKADAMLITHCHMDHIGAITDYINMGFEMPTVYAPAYAGELLKATLALKKTPKDKWPKIETIKAGDKLKFGNFEVEPIAVTHSAPDSVGFYIKTPTMKIFHSGDLKTDQTVSLGKPFDFKRVEEIGKEGIDAVMIDSTSAVKPGKIPPEQSIADEFSNIMEQQKGKRIITPVIASSMQRFASLCEAAAKTGRTVVIEGASLLRNSRALAKAGYDIEKIVEKKTGKRVQIVDNFDQERIMGLKPEEQIVVCTGTQAEKLAAMYRASEGSHPRLKTNAKTDVVIMAQTAIPGNEDNVAEMLNNFRNQGVEVLSSEDSALKGRPTHASGHGSADDMKKIFTALTKNAPEKSMTVLPIHGSTEHLKANAMIAQEMGLKSVITPNFDTVEFTDAGVKAEATKEVPTFIGVNDLNDNFINPDYEYDRVDSKYNKLEKIEFTKIKREQPNRGGKGKYGGKKGGKKPFDYKKAKGRGGR